MSEDHLEEWYDSTDCVSSTVEDKELQEEDEEPQEEENNVLKRIGRIEEKLDWLIKIIMNNGKRGKRSEFDEMIE